MPFLTVLMTRNSTESKSYKMYTKLGSYGQQKTTLPGPAEEWARNIPIGVCRDFNHLDVQLILLNAIDHSIL